MSDDSFLKLVKNQDNRHFIWCSSPISARMYITCTTLVPCKFPTLECDIAFHDALQGHSRKLHDDSKLATALIKGFDDYIFSRLPSPSASAFGGPLLDLMVEGKLGKRKWP